MYVEVKFYFVRISYLYLHYFLSTYWKTRRRLISTYQRTTCVCRHVDLMYCISNVIMVVVMRHCYVVLCGVRLRTKSGVAVVAAKAELVLQQSN
jgi:hypothetical protein